MKYAWYLLFCIAILLLPAKSYAQFLDQGAITGTVQDHSGALIPGSQVTLINTDTAFKLETKTNRSGVYVFSPIKIGHYSLTASAPGFESATQQNITLDLGQRLNISVNLKPGAVSETVTISTAPPLLQSQDSSVGQVLNTQEINDTPLNGRNAIFLVQLTAGAAPAHGSHGAASGDFDANGLRPEQNNFILDGVDNNAVTQDVLSNTSYLVNPPPDALAEFKVSTSDYSAEFGHSAGAVVSASIKEGTNQIHGDIWEYFRNDKLDARDFTAPSNLPIPEYRENEFGATLGLPILKNKLFFFGDAQANRVVLAQPYTQTVPTLLERQGNFTELENTALTGSSTPYTLYEPNSGGKTLMTCLGVQNVLCRNQIDTVAQNILNLYPLPNPNATMITNNNTENLKQPDNTWQWDTRVDWNISEKDQAFVRFSYLNQIGNYQAPLGSILDGGCGEGSDCVSGVQVDYANNFVLSETHIFTPNVVNEFRFAYDFGHFDTLQPNFNTDIAATLGLGGVPFGAGFKDNGGLPTVAQTGGGAIANFGSHAFRPEEEFEDEYQVLDNVSLTLRNHSLKVGFSYQNIRSSTLEPPASHPSYTFNGTYTGKVGTSFTGSGMADFLTDQMSTGSISASAAFNDTQANISGYVQDDWRVTKALTLNIGVRYDFFQPYREMAGNQANFYPTGAPGISTGSGVFAYPAEDQGKLTLAPAFLQNLATDNITLTYDNNPRLTTQQNLNFAPRIGFALLTNPRTVVRGGFGIFYQGQQQAGAADNIGTNYPFVFSSTFPAPTCSVTSCPSNGYTLETGFSAALAQGLAAAVSTPILLGQSPMLKTTYVMDYNFTVEQSLTNDIVATIAYVGTASRHLPVGVNSNDTTVLLPSGQSDQTLLPFPAFGTATDLLYEGISSYNGLQAKLQKRMSRGLDFLATYTWSHSMDDAQDPLGGGITYRDANIIPIRADYTNSGWDVRHRVTMNGFYRLPFGRGQSYLSKASRSVDALLGGWATTVTFQMESGQPFSVSSADTTLAVGGTKFAILTGNPFAPGGSPNATNPSITCPTKVRTMTHWYNPCAFSNPLPSSDITPAGKSSSPYVPAPGYNYPTYVTGEANAKLFLGGVSNQIYGPGFQRLDVSLFKHFQTFRGQYLELRGDAFNVLNTPAYAAPSTANDGQSGGLITGARLVQSDTPAARFFQLSAKYVF